MPINYNETKEAMILLNKTKMSNQNTNGNTALITNIQQKTEELGYDKWAYPTSGTESNTNDVNSPEIIEICE